MKKKQFHAKKSCIKKLLNGIRMHEPNSLPSPDFDAITPYYDDLCMDERKPFSELLEDYLEDKITLALYGQELMKSCLKNKRYTTMDKLFMHCIQINKESEDKFLENIKLLEIVTFSFMELTLKFPQILKKVLSYTSFILSSSNQKIAIRKFSSESHLHSHKKYHLPHFTSNNISYISQHIIRKLFILLKNKISKEPDVNPTAILISPLPKFSSYTHNYNPWKELIFPEPSPFTKYKSSELYKYWHGEALLNFKWDTYGRQYYFAIMIFYSVFMGCFLTVATLESELTKSIQERLLIATIILGVLHFTFELRQFIHSPSEWVTEIWNYFGAMLVPVITSINWLQSSIMPVSAVTISILLLELRFITFFRPIEFFGAYWAMIIGVIENSYSFFIIIGLIMFAFAHSLLILLRPTINALDTSISEELLDTNTNMFVNLNTAFLAVYMMLTGDSSWSITENSTLTILMALFSFFTTVYLMNLFIGWLCTSIYETKRKELFLLQRAKILSEIELFYMLPYQRRKNNWFPEIIFSLDELHDIICKVQKNKWNDTIEIPFFSKKLLDFAKVGKEIDNQEEIQDINKLSAEVQELKENKNKIIKQLEENEKKMLQILENNNEKLIQELKEILKSESKS
ncbi:9688_t:CDS:2 [Scutellospora calospora]|uniref:9688_t:CDS:1 n=1 Tax=Scutellospora calospora TaxID=85575 RepID=A0ACA9LGQ1_9GLOM|nr:9688_t:CDS:2 [Scutellospora calospora]